MTKPAEIPSTMRALVAYGKHDYRLEPAYPVPGCGDDEMLVKSEGSGICAGDLKNYQGASMYWGGDGMVGICRPPFIPGHEFVGRIVKTGKNVTGFQPGDRVVAEQIVPCGHCRFCRTGKYWMCKNRGGFGFYKELNGGMGEYVRFLSETRVYKIPEELPFEKALLIEPYACAKHAVDRADIHCEDVVVISGAGTLGLAMITYARMKNPAKLIVPDINPQRLEKAAEFGADLVMNPAETDAVQAIRDLNRRLRLRHLYRGDRPLRQRGDRPQRGAQAGGLRRVRRLRRKHDGQLVAHRRPQGARHPRGAPEPLLLPVRHREHRKRAPEDRRRGHLRLPHRAVGKGV